MFKGDTSSKPWRECSKLGTVRIPLHTVCVSLDTVRIPLHTVCVSLDIASYPGPSVGVGGAWVRGYTGYHSKGVRIPLHTVCISLDTIARGYVYLCILFAHQ